MDFNASAFIMLWKLLHQLMYDMKNLTGPVQNKIGAASSV